MNDGLVHVFNRLCLSPFWLPQGTDARRGELYTTEIYCPQFYITGSPSLRQVPADVVLEEGSLVTDITFSLCDHLTVVGSKFSGPLL